jgi:hypothetical protein
MIKKSLILFFVLCSEFIVANDPQSIGVSVGTIGADIEYSKLISQKHNLALRLFAGGLSYDDSYDDTDTHYDTNIQLMNLGVTLEYHPLQNGFYVGVGTIFQNNKYTLEAKPKDNKYDFNGNQYLANMVGSVHGETYGLNDLVPYLGVGYDASLFDSGKWFFTFKAGAWYQDSPKLKLTAHDCLLDSIPGSPIGCNDLRYDLDKEEADINEDLETYKWWPVVQFGMSYKF